ncbi:molybdopterin cofactor-binding domain-containing protein [Streptomyces sp. P9-A4]|uniref:molybdopterin cofactor-binding domain-containing protein n=1 Tax=Streptomyces sp. P9-A4 TaxID=3072285 RepID=UPI003FCCB727
MRDGQGDEGAPGATCDEAGQEHNAGREQDALERERHVHQRMQGRTELAALGVRHGPTAIPGGVHDCRGADPAGSPVRVRRCPGPGPGGSRDDVDGRADRQRGAIGGVVGGIGMALLEGTVTDHRDGRIINASLADYLVPVNVDVPELDAAFIDTECPLVDPIGVKGLGEITIVGVPAAIGNAVFNATGTRLTDLPIRP